MTLQVPYSLELDGALTPGQVPPPPVTLPGAVTANGGTLTWLPWQSAGTRPLAREAWQTIVQNMMNSLSARIDASGLNMEARVTLKGHAIFGTIKGAQAWLDGQCFGILGKPRIDGTPRIDLNLGNGVPSGNGAKASDFESWFQVAPAPTLSLSISPESWAAPASSNERVTNPICTITLSSNTVTATTVTLFAITTVPGATTTQSYVSFQNPIIIPQGTGPISVPVTINVTNPGLDANNKPVVAIVRFTASAQLPSGLLITSPQPGPQQTLTITGSHTQFILETGL